MNKAMGAYCVRLSNDPSFFRSNNWTNDTNTCNIIIKNKDNTINTLSHNISKTMESVATFICNNRNGLLFMQPEVVKSVERLRNIENLANDWNGYGAKPFSSALIDKCERIIGTLAVQPSIYPTGRNSIQFQYELSDRSYLEFEIFEEKILCLQVPKRVYANATELELRDTEDNRIKEIVDKFYERDSTEK